jgi:hypothetical protein
VHSKLQTNSKSEQPTQEQGTLLQSILHDAPIY